MDVRSGQDGGKESTCWWEVLDLRAARKSSFFWGGPVNASAMDRSIIDYLRFLKLTIVLSSRPVFIITWVVILSASGLTTCTVFVTCTIWQYLFRHKIWIDISRKSPMIRIDLSHDSERCSLDFNWNDAVSSIYRDFSTMKYRKNTFISF